VKILTDISYNISKTIELLIVRELATHLTSSTNHGNITTSLINPGFVDTEIMRHASFAFSLFVSGLKKLMSRTTEEGGRTLVFAAYGGPETHGMYLDDCTVGKVAPWIVSEDGLETQKKLWAELSENLEKISPGVMLGI
jgi:retinol dehydrogenase-12